MVKAQISKLVIMALDHYSQMCVESQTWSSRFMGCFAQLSMKAKVRFLPTWNFSSMAFIMDAENVASSLHCFGVMMHVLLRRSTELWSNDHLLIPVRLYS